MVVKPFRFTFGFFKNLKVAKLYISRVKSSIYVTLTDIKNSVIICSSTGSANPHFTRRKKLAPFNIDYVFVRVVPFLRRFNVKAIAFVIKMKINTYVNSLVRAIYSRGFKISKVSECKSSAHNGIRKSRAPRK